MMKIKEVKNIIKGGFLIQTAKDNSLMYQISNNTFINNKSYHYVARFEQHTLNDTLYVNNLKHTVYKFDSQTKELLPYITHGKGWVEGVTPNGYILANYNKEKKLREYTCIRNDNNIWELESPFESFSLFKQYALAWKGKREYANTCQLIDLETGKVMWEKEYTEAHIDLVIPFEDKIVIEWCTELSSDKKDKIICVEIPSGKVLWENSTSGNYKKYGKNRLVSFWSHYSTVGPSKNHNQYAEIDTETGEVYIHKFENYNKEVFTTMVYKDYLFYAYHSDNSEYSDRMGVGIIDLRTHEMIQEYDIDSTRGDCNYIKSMGVYKGDLYVEVETEVNHSDIHVFELEEE